MKELDNGILTISGAGEMHDFYPPEEMNVIRLYSWPNTYINYPHNFNRVMTTNVFYDIRHVLEMLGYQFVEE